MNPRKILAACCTVLSIALLAAFITALATQSPRKAYGSIAGNAPVFGNTQLVESGTNALNLSGTASTSIPCENMLLYASGTGCSVGSSSSTATFPLSSGLQSIKFPVTNVNQVWCSVSSGTVTVNACYAQ
jgi:hypothetical protein